MSAKKERRQTFPDPRKFRPDAQEQLGVPENSVKEVEGHFAEVNGIRMYYEIHGEGEPLVMGPATSLAVGEPTRCPLREPGSGVEVGEDGTERCGAVIRIKSQTPTNNDGGTRAE